MGEGALGVLQGGKMMAGISQHEEGRGHREGMTSVMGVVRCKGAGSAL